MTRFGWLVVIGTLAALAAVGALAYVLLSSVTPESPAPEPVQNVPVPTYQEAANVIIEVEASTTPTTASTTIE